MTPAFDADFFAFCTPPNRGTVGFMQLNDDDLREFIQIWSEEFHEPIAAESARRSASLLLDLFALLAFPDAEES